MPIDRPQSEITPQRRFATTRWSVILQAGRNDTPRAQAALATLCRTYWFPLYAQARRSGRSPHDAQDLTQGFFARLLKDDTIAKADPARGRFRSFMLTAFKNFLADDWERLRALKRGGDTEIISLDLAAAEQRYVQEPRNGESPDAAFDRQWALALLQTVVDRLEDDARRSNKLPAFTILRETLAGSRESQPYAELATRLNMSEGAVKVAVHRLRKRYREVLEAEIAQTVGSEAEIKEELEHLISALAG